jgi:hypothetical protein
MGAYELIRRRVPWIIICDAEQDRDYTYQGLANFVRKARTDFNAEIEFLTEDELDDVLDGAIRPLFGTLDQVRRGKWSEEPVRSPLVHRLFPFRRRRLTVEPAGDGHFSLAHAALAWVYYDRPEPDSGPDRPPDGMIIYLKPTMTGDEPADVLQYYSDHADFPQQTTVDQFFDEEQWESYRKLGEHIAGKVFARPSTARSRGFPSHWIRQRHKPTAVRRERSP